MAQLDMRALDDNDLAALQQVVEEVMPGARLYIRPADNAFMRDDDDVLKVRVSVTYAIELGITEEALASSVEDARRLLADRVKDAASRVRAGVERVGLLAGAERLARAAEQGVTE